MSLFTFHDNSKDEMTTVLNSKGVVELFFHLKPIIMKYSRILQLLFVGLFFSYQFLVSAQTYVSGAIISNTNWPFDNSPYVLEGYVNVAGGVTLTIEAGVVIKLKEYAEMHVNGSLIAQGTTEDPIVFTSILDDDHAGDTNGDGSMTSPYISAWNSLSLAPSSNGSIINNCLFFYGGWAEEIGALESWSNYNSISDCQFYYCGTGLQNFGDQNSFSNLSFENCEYGIINRGGQLSIHNSSFENSIYFSFHNDSSSDVDASENWWGLEEYITLFEFGAGYNLSSIHDQHDDPDLGKVNLTNPSPPSLALAELLSVSPGIVHLSEESVNGGVLGFPFEASSEIIFQKNSGPDLIPSSIEFVDDFHLNFNLNFASAEPGVYDVLVTNPGSDTLRLKNSFSILDIEIDSFLFNQWIPFEVGNGDAFTSGIIIPEVDNLFVLLKKSSRISYSSTWIGNLNITHSGEDILLEDNYDSFLGGGFADIDAHIQNPVDGLYLFEIETTSEQGEGLIMFTDAPPSLQLGEWDTGEILRPYGYDWKYIDVPDGQDTLYLKTQGFGLWSSIEVFYESINDDAPKWFFNDWGQGYQIEGKIANPVAGRYYIRYKDSAVLQNDNSGDLFTNREDQYRNYLIIVSSVQINDQQQHDLTINGLSTYNVGQGIVSFEILGAGFSEDDIIKLSNGATDVFPEIQNLNSEKGSWYLTFDLSMISTGNWDVEIINGNTTAISPTPLTIVLLQELPISTNLIFNPQIRAGRWQTVVVEVSNSSNVDAFAIPVSLHLSDDAEVFNDPDLFTIPQVVSDSMSVTDWEGWEDYWEDWVDVPYYYDFLDSVSGEVTRLVPILVPRIKANTSISIELSVKYNTIGTTSLRTVATFPLLDNEDFLRYSTDECLETILIKAGETFMESVLPFSDIQSCALDVAKLMRSTAESVAEIDMSQHPDSISIMPFISLLPDLGTAYISCAEAAVGSIPNPYVKGAKILFDVLGKLNDVNDIVEACTPEEDGEDELPESEDYADAEVVGSTTPEDKFGIIGTEQTPNLPMSERQNFIRDTTDFEYRIDYWNKEDATAPAGEVFIRDTLDENFDLATFDFTEIGFLRWQVPLDGGHYFNVTVDMRPDYNYLVNVEGTLNPYTREVYWVHKTLDPETLETPDDPLAGYLPPVDPLGYNIGWVKFQVKPKNNLTSGTIFENQARVNFDGIGPWGPAPPYGPFVNTLDFEAPISKVFPLDPESMDTTFTISWGGNDGDGCGIQHYDVFVAANNDNFTLWLNNTSATSTTFTGEIGNSYHFYSVATDKVGNREEDEGIADASTDIILNADDIQSINDIKVSPNPAENELMLTIHALKAIPHTKIRISNYSGQLISEREQQLDFGFNAFNLNISDLIPGFYILTVITEEGNNSFRFVKI